MSVPAGLEAPDLPGHPPAKLQALYGALTASQKAALLPVLVGPIGADVVADVLTRHGHPIGPITIKNYRRKLRQTGESA